MKSIVIKISNPFLKLVRDNLRALILSAINDKKGKLYNRRKNLLFNEKGVKILVSDLGPQDLALYEELGEEWWELERRLRRSILLCPLCNSTRKNMVYNPKEDAWFCVECNSRFP